MMNEKNPFVDAIEEAVTRFKEIDRNEVIRVISHLDSDGVCASAILIKALDRDNRKYSLSIVPQLSENILLELSREDYSVYVFTDLGSGQIRNVAQLLADKRVFILDHHITESDEKYEHIVHVNPHLYGIDGSTEISGSGVVYRFAEVLDKANSELAYIAVIGAIGDVQENNGFHGLNKAILDEAIKNKKIAVNHGLRFFGIQTRPIHKVLEYCTDPFIPGISGSESGAIQFLQQIGINPKTDKGWKKIIHLSEEDMKKLTEAIIMKRMNEENPEDVLGNIYTLTEEKEESPLRDAREFSTLLNACGRMDKASLGIGACLGDEHIKKKAINQLKEYKREIIAAMRWFEENNGSEKVVREPGFVIINAEDNVKSTMIGTIASILSRSKHFDDGTFILSMAQTMENTTKISLRLSGIRNNGDIDLKEIISEITEKVKDAQAGGHMNAAGAIIPTEAEDEFINAAKEVLLKRSMEERV